MVVMVVMVVMVKESSQTPEAPGGAFGKRVTPTCTGSFSLYGQLPQEVVDPKVVGESHQKTCAWIDDS